MAQTLPDIKVTSDDWVSVNTLASIPVGGYMTITNKSSREVLLFEGDTKPVADSTDGILLSAIGGSEPSGLVPARSLEIWAKGLGGRAVLSVQQSSVITTNVVPLEVSDRGSRAIPVIMTDQTTQAIDVFFTSKKADVTTATVATQGEHTVTLEPGQGAGLVVGDVIESRTAENFVQAEIINIAVDTITVATPWSRTFAIGTTVGVGSPNMNVLGSQGSPVIFSIDPSVLQTIDLTRIILNFVDNSAMDFTTFGSLAKLTTGVTLRYKQSDGTFINLFNFRTNGELIERSFDHTFQSKVGGGEFGFVARSTWAGSDKRGVAVRIDGSLLEEFQIVVQDDLTTLSQFRVVGQGHVVQ